MKYDAIAVGQLLVDLLEESKNDEGYPVFSSHPGGAPANFICTMAKLGMQTAFAGKVGQDGMGVMLRRALEGCGVDTSMLISDPHYFTTLAFVTLDEHGDRSFSYARKSSADIMFRPDELQRSISDTQLLYFGSVSMTVRPERDTVLRAVAMAQSEGAVIFYDPNLRLMLWESEDLARKEMVRGASLADVIKISLDEVQFLYGCGAEEGAERLHRIGTALVFVTMGKDGCYYSHQNGVHGFLPSVRTPCIDATGAGDIFGGAAATALLRSGADLNMLDGARLREITAFATAAAALSIGKHGGITSIPELSEVQELARRIEAAQ